MYIRKKLLYNVVCLVTVAEVMAIDDPQRSSNEDLDDDNVTNAGRSVQLLPGISLIVEKNEITLRFAPEELTRDSDAEGKKKDESEKNGLAQYAPMMTMIPFLLQLLSLPGALASIKMSLLKSLLVAKLALGIMIYNAIRNSQNKEEVVVVHQAYHEHYGHFHHDSHAEEEDDGWFGRRRRR